MPKSEPRPPASYEGDAAQDSRYRILLGEDDRLDQIIFRKFVRDAGLSYDGTLVSSGANQH
jgi:hypothetical protein